ncbi:cytochrome P450 monooxygenase pc-2 [Cryptococcus deuterogattii LA55]|nr:cytochrome P450 monooxygenase pc-2 [Cryptococcus deuterogattii LA55]KIR92342.1 cytochrome P450 monooxygenase pc-2 [Cryptococcus deuterogattii CBS 10090]
MKGGRFLLPALFKTLILPPLIAALFTHHFPSLSLSLTALIYLISLPALYVFRSYVSLVTSSRRAAALGAVDIPRVKGAWPLNIDVLLNWAKSGTEEEVGRMMALMGRQYGGTYNTRVLGEDQIISSDPKVIKHVLIDDFDNFVKGQKFKDRAQNFLGDGIFNSDGDGWKFHRSLMRPFFHPMYISPLHFTVNIQAFFNSLPLYGKAFDMQACIGQLALELAIMWLCGEDMSADASNVERTDEWRKAKREIGWAMTEAQKVVGKRVKIGTVWPLFEITHDPLERPMKVIRAFFRPIISQALNRKRQRCKSDDQEDAYMIDRLVEATDDVKLVEDQLINVLLASRDTLASLLIFSVYAIALHPDIAARLKNEIFSVASRESEVTKDTIRQLRYSRAFINEVLRLFPPVPLNIRRTLRPSLLPTTSHLVYMPANTSIILATILMQRDPAVWGEDALVFNPDRWLAGGLGKQRENFASWNLGPRMCLGQPFALTITHTFLVYFFRHIAHVGTLVGQNTTIQLALDAQPPKTLLPKEWMTSEGSDGRTRGGRDRVWIVADVVLAIKGGLWVRFGAENTE